MRPCSKYTTQEPSAHAIDILNPHKSPATCLAGRACACKPPHDAGYIDHGLDMLNKLKTAASTHLHVFQRDVLGKTAHYLTRLGIPTVDHLHVQRIRVAAVQGRQRRVISLRCACARLCVNASPHRYACMHVCCMHVCMQPCGRLYHVHAYTFILFAHASLILIMLPTQMHNRSRSRSLAHTHTNMQTHDGVLSLISYGCFSALTILPTRMSTRRMSSISAASANTTTNTPCITRSRIGCSRPTTRAFVLLFCVCAPHSSPGRSLVSCARLLYPALIKCHGTWPRALIEAHGAFFKNHCHANGSISKHIYTQTHAIKMVSRSST
jgi:hypothetical protein